MSDCWSSHHREPAMDDSIDAESFHNGSIGSGGGQRKTHGSYISSNASRVVSGVSAGHSVTKSKLGSPFITPTNPGCKSETGSFVEVPRGPAPSAASRANTDRTGRSEGESGVLVDESAVSSQNLQQGTGPFSTPLNNSNPRNANWLRPAPVAYEGSPLPRAMRTGRPDWSGEASLRGTSHVQGSLGSGSGNTEPQGWGILDHGFGWGGGALPSHHIGSQCQSSCYRSPVPAFQAYCRTATPERGEIELIGCNGACWGPCDQCHPNSPRSLWSAPKASTNGERMNRPDEWSNAGPSHIAESVTAAVADTAWAECKMPATSPLYGAAGNKAIAPGLSQFGGTISEEHAPTRVPPTAQYAVPDAEYHRDNQKWMLPALKEEEDMLAARFISHSAGKVDLEHGLSNLEQRVFARLDMLEKRVGGTEKGTFPTALVGSAMNNVASISAGNAHGCGASRTDLDIRDLNKQVLKMNSYEKFKRERDLTDRLARLEEQLTTKSTPTGNAMGPTSNPQDIVNLRYQLIQQRHEISNLKQELSPMPEVRGELVNLGNEALWTRDRINNLENIACEQQRAAQAVYRGDTYGVENSYGLSDPQAVRSTQEDALPPHAWSGGFAAPTYETAESLVGEEYDAWGEPTPPPYTRQHPKSQDGRSQSSYNRFAINNGGWARYSPSVRSYGTLSPQSGWGRGPTSEKYETHEAFGYGDSPRYRPSYDLESDASEMLDRNGSFGFMSKPGSNMTWNMNTGQARFWSAANPSHVDRDVSSVGSGSFDSRSRAPTVETILDEDEFKPFASRTYDSGTSWAMVHSQPQTRTDRTSFQTLERPSAGSDSWTQVSSRPDSRAPNSNSPSISSIRPADTCGRFGRDRHYGPPAATWEGVNPSWGSARGGSRNSSKQSRDHWRRPTTPSKFEGETGLGSGGGWD